MKIAQRTNADQPIHHADKFSSIRSTETVRVLPEHTMFMQTRSMKVYTSVVMLD